MSKVSNVITMLELLQNGKKYSINELSNELEVSKRMIRVYKEDLEKAGIYVDTIMGPYGGYVLNQQIRMPIRKFKLKDAKLLDKYILKEKDKKKIKQNAFYKPLSRIIKVTGIYIAVMLLNLSTEANITLVKLYKIALIICVSNGLADIFNPKSVIFEKLEEKTKYSGDKQLNNFVSKIAKAVIYFVAIYLVLLELGYNLGGLVTGLGISSVIIAFAAQDIAKNLFGGFAIITDKPFSVGDWIEVGDYSGTVIDITFRSTKIKAVDNTIITINNSTVVESFVKNWGNIDKRRYTTTLNLPLNTSEATVKRLLKKIEFALKANPQIVPDSLQVHFENIKLEGIQIFIYLNSTQTGYDDYEKFKDDINLEILKVLESENVKLSYPGQNIYIKEKPMNDTQDQK